MQKTHENNQNQGLKWPKCSSPTPLSLLPSLPLFLKRDLFYSVIPRKKKQLEILTCLIALIIFIKRLM